MTKEENNLTRSEQSLPLFAKISPQKIKINLSNTFLIGSITGIIGIVGYTLNLKNSGSKILFLSILLSAASYISGFFLGFLFGIPKRNTSTDSDYNLSTNLVDISDWLTKIIIGLGLVEIKKIPEVLESVGIYIQQTTGGDDSIRVFSVCCIVYFSIFGLYYGYNYMRLILSGQFKEADDNLLEKKKMLSASNESLNKQDLAPANLDEAAKRQIKEYDTLLKSTKTENDYTADDWYFKAIEAYNNKEYNKTIAYMRNTLEKDPIYKNAPNCYLYIGLAYYGLKLFDNAIEANSKIINGYKNYKEVEYAHYNNGIYYTELGQFDKALQEYDIAISLNSTSAEFFNGKGYLLKKMERFDEAMDAFNKALSLDPNFSDSRYSRASIFAIKKEKDSMLSDLKELINLNPKVKNYVRQDKDFQEFQNDEDFIKLVT